MITVFIGSNAEGKTLKLLELMRDCSTSYASNIKPELLEEIELLKSSCEIAASNISASRLITSKNDVVCADFFRKEDEQAYAREFFNLLTIICKDVKQVFLDEPMIEFKSLEDSDLYRIIEEISKKCNVDFFITTHSDSFLCIDSVNVFLIENGELRSEVTEDDLNELLWSF